MDRLVTSPPYRSFLHTIGPRVPQRLRRWLALSAVIHLVVLSGLIIGRYRTQHGMHSAVMVSLDGPNTGSTGGARPASQTARRQLVANKTIGTPAAVIAPNTVSLPISTTAPSATVTSPPAQPGVRTTSGGSSTHNRTLPGTHSTATASSNGRLGGGTTVIDGVFGQGDGPRFSHRVTPEYPAQAYRRQREGVVLLRLTITEQGTLSHLELVQDPGFGFADTAIQAIRRSRFTPGTRNGKPVAMRILLPIRFVLEDR